MHCNNDLMITSLNRKIEENIQDQLMLKFLDESAVGDKDEAKLEDSAAITAQRKAEQAPVKKNIREVRNSQFAHTNPYPKHQGLAQIHMCTNICIVHLPIHVPFQLRPQYSCRIRITRMIQRVGFLVCIPLGFSQDILNLSNPSPVASNPSPVAKGRRYRGPLCPHAAPAPAPSGSSPSPLSMRTPRPRASPPRPPSESSLLQEFELTYNARTHMLQCAAA